MVRRGNRIEGRNPPRSRFKNNDAVCAQCGRTSYKSDLIPQRGVMVDRTHAGCVDELNTFQGTLQRGPHYGGS